MYYDLPSDTSLPGFLKWEGSVTSGLMWYVVVLSLFVVLYSAFSRKWSTRESSIASAFACTVVSVFLVALELVSFSVFIQLELLLAVFVVVLR